MDNAISEKLKKEVCANVPFKKSDGCHKSGKILTRLEEPGRKKLNSPRKYGKKDRIDEYQ